MVSVDHISSSSAGTGPLHTKWHGICASIPRHLLPNFFRHTGEGPMHCVQPSGPNSEPRKCLDKSGTGVSQRRPGASTVAHLSNNRAPRTFLSRDTGCFCGGQSLEVPSFSCCTSAMRSCCGWDAGQRIFDVLAQAHKDITECDDQDDFDNPLCKLHRERNQTPLQFASVSSRRCVGHDLPQTNQDPKTSGQAHHGGNHGSRNFSVRPGGPRRKFPRRPRHAAETTPMMDGTTMSTTSSGTTTWIHRHHIVPVSHEIEASRKGVAPHFCEVLQWFQLRRKA